MKTLIGNGYPPAFVRSAAAQQAPREPRDKDDDETEKPPVALLPYAAGISERIRKACRDFSVRAAAAFIPWHKTSTRFFVETLLLENKL